MGQKYGEKWTAAVDLQPTIPKSDRLLELSRNRPAVRTGLGGFRSWLRSHRDSVTMAGLLAFAAPVTFFFGVLSVMREPASADMTRLALWWLLYGFELWGLLL